MGGLWAWFILMLCLGLLVAFAVYNCYCMQHLDSAGWCSGEFCAGLILRSCLSPAHGFVMFLLLSDVLSRKID